MAAISLRRLYQQGLATRPFATPEEVVGWLGAVQAQDYPGAKWALGIRIREATDDTIERAFDAGRILRTHVMRPTWHFLTPEDIRWILELTAPRVHAVNAYMYRKLELDDGLLARGAEIMARALVGGRQLTREELGAALAEAGIIASGMRLGYLVHWAELETIVCSGPRRGKQFTYMLLAERAPRARRLERDEALAELTRRYYIGHGPATTRDFSWWSGLTLADVKKGLVMAGAELEQEEIDGETYWSGSSVAPSEPRHEAWLLPTYDEFFIGYSAFAASRTGGQDVNAKLIFDSTIVIGGKIAGSWKRTLGRGAVKVELAPFAPLSPADEEAVHEAARRYGAFVGLPVNVSDVGPLGPSTDTAQIHE